MRLCYAAIPPGGDMDAYVRSDLSGAEEDRAVAQMGGDQSLADAAALREAMHGGLTGLGTDEDAIYQVLRNRTPEEREAIRGAYLAKYGEDLQGDLESELSREELDRANALMQGLTARADAIAIDEAIHGTFLGLGLGTDEDAINAVYETNRQEVQEDARRHPGWSQAQVEAAIRARSADVELQYIRYFGAPGTDATENDALRSAYRDELSGAELNLTLALANNDRAAEDAARIKVESDSFFYASDAASTPSSRGRSIARSRAFSRPGAGAGARDEGAREERRRAPESMGSQSLAVRAARARGLTGRAREAAGVGQHGRRRAALQRRLPARSARSRLPHDARGQYVGYDADRARTLVEQGGYLSPAQQVYFASTASAPTRRCCAARSRAARRRRSRRFAGSTTGGTHPKTTFAATRAGRSTRLRRDVAGEPDNPQERVERLRRRVEWERDEGTGGSVGSRRARTWIRCRRSCTAPRSS